MRAGDETIGRSPALGRPRRDAFRLRPWFSRAEHERRLGLVQQLLQELRLEGVIALQPETVTWLTGFFTRGYTSFQCAVAPLTGEAAICCRDMEEYYLEHTCAFETRALWSDSDEPVDVAAALVVRVVGDAERIGIEKSAWQLSAATFEQLQSALPRVQFVDVGPALARLRWVKSADEIDYQRRAARAAEAGMRAAVETARAGTSERQIAAAVCTAMILAGSDVPGPGVLSSGERALHLHGGYTDRVLRRGDVVQLECCPAVCHYHARFMRPIKVGSATGEDHELARQIIEIQDQALAAVRPGVVAAVPDAIYREEVLARGLVEHYTNKTFYSIGLLLPPSGGESLQAAPGASWVFEPGMTFHTYVLARGLGFSETIAITHDGYERLTQFPRELMVGGE